MWLIDGKKAVEKAECYGWDTVPIYNAPTVEAIPVSFIKEQIENLQGIADYEFIESGGYIGACNHELWALQDLLKHWAERKEE